MKLRLKLILISFFLFSTVTHAVSTGGITIGGTRLVYNGGKKEASINVSNSDKSPYLIQSWVEGDLGGGLKAPFIVTPPLFRLDSDQQNMLRVIRTGGNLPEDKESLFWLNVKSIPATTTTETTNTLQIAVKTRIKLIYRPKNLKDDPLSMAKNLKWTENGGKITVNNPTPYYMNFQEVNVGGKQLKNVNYVAPKSTVSFNSEGATGNITWKIITDYGGVSETFGLGH
ncbi:TPA: molecular chaperone [Klebsiella quasipneumoniae subsp. similipneumoniae]|nr:molecular chaperone [Klebsiella quasipneumoniae subsp. similipneumoniae]